jgi:hypothetical protein
MRLATRSHLLSGVATLGFVVAMTARASAQLAVLSNLVEERTGSPGERYSGRITVVNTTNQPQSARIYQTDFRFAADGTSHTDDPGSSPRSNAPWVHPQMTRLSIAPGAQVSVPYTVDVPATDSLHGTYWSMIMIEGMSGSSSTPSMIPGGQQGVGVGSVVRYAIQIATHVGSSGTRGVQFTNVNAVRNADGTGAVNLDVVNTGERGYRPTLWIEVYDAAGVLRAKGKQVRGLLYPGTSLRQHYDLGTLPSGSYKALIFADTGTEPVFASQIALVF